MILFSAKNIYAQVIIFNTSFILSSSSFASFSPHILKTQKFCKVKPIHRNHVFGMTVFYQLQITGNNKGLYATMRGGRIDPSSCLDTCWVDDMTEKRQTIPSCPV